MNYGEQLGAHGGDAGERSEAFNFGPENLPQPNILNDGERLNEGVETAEQLRQTEESAAEQLNVDSRQVGTAAVNAAQLSGEAPKMGEVVDADDAPLQLTEETILSTETGSIEDKDGVTPDEEKRVNKIMKIEDLHERAIKQQLERKRFLVGRYADRAYLKEEGK